MNRTKFPKLFWIANSIEILERFAYYGIFMGFSIYMQHLGYTRSQLGIVQSIFLFTSYFVPIFSGAFADRFGFKKVLIVSYLAYIPSILLLIFLKSYNGIVLSMLSIGFAAGIFKPLISGTIRLTTDNTNKTLGFGIFYLMVNLGASFGPIIAGYLRSISWDYAFLMAAVSISIMFLITLLFYKEPPREIVKINIKEKFFEIFQTITDKKFAIFLILLGIFFWLPFWSFFNLAPAYVDRYINTELLFKQIETVFGFSFARILAHQENNTWYINGEAIAHTGWIILLFQLIVSKIFEKKPALQSFIFGMLIASLGFLFMSIIPNDMPYFVLLAIFIFAIGEMISSPRIQEYITWIAPREKAGMYMGANFLATCIGALLSGFYTSLFGYFEKINSPQKIWIVLSINLLVGCLIFLLFIYLAGSFKEKTE